MLVGMERGAGSTWPWTARWSVLADVFGMTRPRPTALSRIPSTAVLPTTPRPALSFLPLCLLASFAANIHLVDLDKPRRTVGSFPQASRSR